jgi:hypothetical protein
MILCFRAFSINLRSALGASRAIVHRTWPVSSSLEESNVQVGRSVALWVDGRARGLAAGAMAQVSRNRTRLDIVRCRCGTSTRSRRRSRRRRARGRTLDPLGSSVGEAHGRLTPSETKFENYTDQRGTSLLPRSLPSLSGTLVCTVAVVAACVYITRACKW